MDIQCEFMCLYFTLYGFPCLIMGEVMVGLYVGVWVVLYFYEDFSSEYRDNVSAQLGFFVELGNFWNQYDPGNTFQQNIV